MIMKPSQCRAGRALLDWTQDELEAKAAVSKKSIAEFERGNNVPYDRTLRQLQQAMEVSGVEFIDENGGGAGVRLKAAIPTLTRKRASRFNRLADLAVSYRGRDYMVRLGTDILDDMDRTNHQTDADYEHSMDAHMNLILLTAAAAIDDKRVDQDGLVVLTNDDFLEETGPRRRRQPAEQRFIIGQKYVNKRPPHRVVEVVQLADDGRKAWVDMRTPEGVLLDSAWVVFAQFSQHWTLA